MKLFDIIIAFASTLLFTLFCMAACSQFAHAETHYSEVKPVLQKNCSQCHDYLYNKNWQIYADAFKYKDQIKKKLLDKSMPMGKTIGDMERDFIIKWVDEGGSK